MTASCRAFKFCIRGCVVGYCDSLCSFILTQKKKKQEIVYGSPYKRLPNCAAQLYATNLNINDFSVNWRAVTQVNWHQGLKYNLTCIAFDIEGNASSSSLTQSRLFGFSVWHKYQKYINCTDRNATKCPCR